MKVGQRIFIEEHQSYAQVTELQDGTPTKAQLPTGEIIELVGLTLQVINLLDRIIARIDGWIQQWKARKSQKK